MLTLYSIIEDKLFNEKNAGYISFGIEAKTTENDIVTDTKTIHDIFINKNKMQNFIDLCNKEDLSILHFKDVVDDLISIK